MFQRFIYAAIVLIILYVILAAVPGFPFASIIQLVAVLLAVLYVLGARINA